ncbi:MAG: rhomboid family intramembrane serine protease [Candidatus Kapabacteria bacterium]|nr:rhomboid family intramembrane serine protease [Candidatus Kapabacteria bacterium]
MSELGLSPLTLTIVIATVAVTIVSFRSRALYKRLLFSVNDVLGERTEWWRIATCSLVHADYMHLAFNMFSLFMFGRWFEHIIGSWRFGLLYLLGAVAGSFASLIVHRNAPSYRAVGASGAVCAVIAASTVLMPDLPMMFLFLPIPLPAWIMGSLFVFYSTYVSGKGYDSIGHEAHLGGTFSGIGMMIAFYPALALENYYAIAAMLAAGAAAWMLRRR